MKAWRPSILPKRNEIRWLVSGQFPGAEIRSLAVGRAAIKSLS